MTVVMSTMIPVTAVMTWVIFRVTAVIFDLTRAITRVTTVARTMNSVISKQSQRRLL